MQVLVQAKNYLGQYLDASDAPKFAGPNAAVDAADWVRAQNEMYEANKLHRMNFRIVAVIAEYDAS